ncbi:ubiquinone biosynthesis protein UbiB [Candidatus Pelagibacter sp.]|nr:ubiquinone biosynthesis protein UbiB [Candidatus Pelagibacter sp.]
MKVCILGNSLSSLTLAKALVNKNIYVDLWISKKTSQPDKSRTIGISKSNVDFFNKHIVNIENISWKLNKIEIFTDNLKNEKLLNFENPGYELFSIIKNSHLFKILEKSLSQNQFFKKIKKGEIKSVLDSYNLVINTDYSNPISKKYFNKKIIKKYDSTAYTTILKHDTADNKTAIQVFTKRGPLAFLPISKNETSIVYSLNDKLTFKKNENIEELIRGYNFKYNIKKIEKIASFELKSFILRSYYHNNIVAFGDLLHKIHPLAGQGFNMTIRDLRVFLELIDTRLNLGLALDSSINSEFDRILRHKNFIFSNGIDLIHEFFNFERKYKNNTISKSVQFIGKNPLLNKVFTNIADKGIIF